jgi:hypothetical protein
MATTGEPGNEPEKSDPVAILRELRESGQGLDPSEAEAYLAQVYEDRGHLRSHTDEEAT